MEIAEGIHRIATEFAGRSNHCYLLRGTDAAMLVDTGVTASATGDLEPALAALGVGRLDHVVNTHADLDHVGGNGAVVGRHPEAALTCQVLDRRWIEDFDVLIDERYDEFAEFGLPETEEAKQWLRDITSAAPVQVTFDAELEVELGSSWSVTLRHAPGHSPGHLVVHDPRSSVAIIGDAVLYDGLYTADGAPAFPPTYRTVDEYERTMDALESWHLERLLTSHYRDELSSDVEGFLAVSRDFVDRTRRALLEQLDREGRSLPDLVASLAPKLGSWDPQAGLSLKYPLLGHLEELEQRGVARRSRRDGEVTWTHG